MADDETDDTESESAPAPTAKRRDRRPRVFALGLLIPLLVACSCGGCSVMLRGWVAGRLASSALATRGISCDDLSIDVGLALDQATVAPTTCRATEGAIESIELVDPVTVDLVAFTPTRIDAGRVRIGLRGEAPVVEAGALGPVAGLMHVPERVGLLLQATGDVAAAHPPNARVATLEVMRGDEVSVAIEELALDGAEPLGVTAREVTLPSLDGPLGARAEVRIDALHGSATADDVALTGSIHLRGSAPIVGEVQREGEVTVQGTALTSPSPSYSIRL